MTMKAAPDLARDDASCGGHAVLPLKKTASHKGSRVAWQERWDPDG